MNWRRCCCLPPAGTAWVRWSNSLALRCLPPIVPWTMRGHAWRLPAELMAQAHELPLDLLAEIVRHGTDRVERCVGFPAGATSPRADEGVRTNGLSSQIARSMSQESRKNAKGRPSRYPKNPSQLTRKRQLPLLEHGGNCTLFRKLRASPGASRNAKSSCKCPIVRTALDGGSWHGGGQILCLSCPGCVVRFAKQYTRGHIDQYNKPAGPTDKKRHP